MVQVGWVMHGTLPVGAPGNKASPDAYGGGSRSPMSTLAEKGVGKRVVGGGSAEPGQQSTGRRPARTLTDADSTHPHSTWARPDMTGWGARWCIATGDVFCRGHKVSSLGQLR